MTRTLPQITVLIVTFNNELTIHDCLNALENSRDADMLDIRIWDNASEDATADIIERDFPAVHLKRFGKNIGFGAALNALAEKVDAPAFLLLNPDTEICPDAIPQMRQAAADHTDAGIVGALRICDPNTVPGHALLGQITLSSLWLRALGLARLLPLIDRELTRIAHHAQPFDVDLVEGSCMLVRNSLWRRLGGFDPAFFLYGEDHDLCLRGRAIGARVLMAPSARFTHLVAGSKIDLTLRKILFLGGRAELCRRTLPETHTDHAIRALKSGVWLRKLLSRRRDIDWQYVWDNRAIWTISPPNLTHLRPPRGDHRHGR